MEQRRNNLPAAPKGHPDKEAIRQKISELPGQAPLASSDLAFLEHISRCSYCAEHLAEQTEEEGLLHAPRDFRETVLSRAKSTKTQTELTLHKASAKMQLFFYSLRVGAAVLGAFGILFLSSAFLNLQTEQAAAPPSTAIVAEDEAKPSLSERLNQGSNYVSGLLQDFSNKLIRMEVDQHD